MDCRTLRALTVILILEGCSDDISKRARESCAVICDCVVQSAGHAAESECLHSCTSMVHEDSTVDQCREIVNEIGFSECRSSCEVLASSSDDGLNDTPKDAGTTRDAALGGSSPRDAGVFSCTSAVRKLLECGQLLLVSLPDEANLSQCCNDFACGTRDMMACVLKRTPTNADTCQQAFTACTP